MNKIDNSPTQSYLLVPLAAALAYLRFESFEAATFGATAVLILVIGYNAGTWLMLWENSAEFRQKVWVALLSLFNLALPEKQITLLDYDVYLGDDVDTGKPIIASLERLGSFGVYAITGGGKTTAVHSIVHWLIKHHTPDELKLVISDLKDGLDFRIYRAIPHLLFPIATDTAESETQITGLLEEKKRRSRLFKAIPSDRVCNNMEDYHRLSQELNLDLPLLPRILAIFDEFQNVTLENEEALNGLVKLAKEGRAFGITIICSTQLPNVEAVPTKLKSQFSSNLCGYLTNPSHYYKIAELEKDWWSRMPRKIPGRFVATVAGERLLMQAYQTPRHELESLARELSNGRTEPQWDKEVRRETAVSKYDWTGSVSQKRAMLFEWFEGYEEQPGLDDFLKNFTASRRTYFEWVPKTWGEYQD